MKKYLYFTILFCALGIMFSVAFAGQTKNDRTEYEQIVYDLNKLSGNRLDFADKAMQYTEKCTCSSEESRLLCYLVQKGTQYGNNASSWKQDNRKWNLPEDKRNRVYFDAAKIFMRARNYSAAEFLGNTVPEPVPYYDVEMISQAPIGVYGWKNSELIKNKLKRENRFDKYSAKKIAVLQADVLTGRNSKKNVTPAETKCTVSFFVSADPSGLSIYAENNDTQADEVEAGILDGGSLEMYLQPGFENVYYQWLAHIHPEKVEAYDWMSPHNHFRTLKTRIKYESARIPEGFGMYFFIPWELVYDNLPKDGDEWVLGILPWIRSGSYTWGSG